jgi:putative MFS transporter
VSPEQVTLEARQETVPFWKSKNWALGAIGFLFDAFDVALFSFALVLFAQEWGLDAAQKGLLGSVNSLGMAVGAMLAGVFADRWGRRVIFLGTLLLFGLGTSISALATGFWVMLLFRLIIGIGLGGEVPIAATYVSETARETEKGRAVVMAESFWAIGWILASLVSYFIMPEYGWRIALLTGGLPALYVVYLRRNLRESQVYIRAKEKSKSVIPLRQLFSSEYKKGTVTLWVLWFTINFAYYGMFLWLPSIVLSKGFSLVQSFEYTLAMTFMQLPGYMLAAWLIERIGRKYVLTVFIVGTAICAYGFGASESLGILLLFGGGLNFFNLGAWGALYAYTPEIYPSLLRARGSGFASGFGRLGSIIAPYIVGFLISLQFETAQIFWIFVAVLMIGALTVYFIGPETKSMGKEVGKKQL